MKDIIHDLKTNKTISANSLLSKTIKQAKDAMSFLLSELINSSFRKGIFLSALKISKIVPVFKSKSRLLCNNYRPISLLSNVSKIIEKLMYKRLNKFVEQERCFYNLQFGFHVNCSTYEQCTHANYTKYPDSLRRWQICCRSLC